MNKRTLNVLGWMMFFYCLSIGMTILLTQPIMTMRGQTVIAGNLPVVQVFFTTSTHPRFMFKMCKFLFTFSAILPFIVSIAAMLAGQSKHRKYQWPYPYVEFASGGVLPYLLLGVIVCWGTAITVWMVLMVPHSTAAAWIQLHLEPYSLEKLVHFMAWLLIQMLCAFAWAKAALWFSGGYTGK